MSHLPGEVVLPPAPGKAWLDELASNLRLIHEADVEVPYQFESWNDFRGADPPDWWRDMELWDLAQSAVSATPEFKPVFIHRDYHPMNLLWLEGRVSGIVDWINACMGPIGIDVAHCRLNLALMYGGEAPERFLAAYSRLTPTYRHDARWDVEDALAFLPNVEPYPPWAQFGLTGLTRHDMTERLQAFVGSALKGPRAR